ncbi:MAG TPA: L,D-transpeptidase family protein [Planctomycetota bacterium]
MGVWKDDKVATEVLGSRRRLHRPKNRPLVLGILVAFVLGAGVYVFYRRPVGLTTISRQVPVTRTAETEKVLPAKASAGEAIAGRTAGVPPARADAGETPAVRTTDAAKRTAEFLEAPKVQVFVMPRTTLGEKLAPASSVAARTSSVALPQKTTRFSAAYSALNANKPEAALAALKSAETSAGTPDAKEAAVLEGRALLALGKVEDARKKFEPLAFASVDTAVGADALFGNFLCQAGMLQRCRDSELDQVRVGAPSWGSAMAALEEARRAEKDANGEVAALEKARALYQQAIDAGKLDEQSESECLARLRELTDKLVLDPKARCTAPKAVFHQVEPGDGVEKIARKYKVNQGQIKRINHLNDKLTVRYGETLKMLPGDVVYKVNHTRLTGTLYIDGVFIRRYPVGVGAGNATPLGSYAVERKVTNPDWYYDGKKIPFGDAGNILGTRWMGFAGTDTHGAGLGIHGTSVPSSVPGRESKGCVRMLNDDVEELYDLMPQGGKVEIVE